MITTEGVLSPKLEKCIYIACEKCKKKHMVEEYLLKEGHNTILLNMCKKCYKKEDIIVKKKCTKCENTKEYKEFNKCKSNKDGLSSYCKQCLKEYRKTYDKKHKTRLMKYRNEYRAEHKDKVREYNRRYMAKKKSNSSNSS